MSEPDAGLGSPPSRSFFPSVRTPQPRSGPAFIRNAADMLKGGIFLDVENLTRNGGYGMRFRAVNELVQGQGATVVRANAYMAVDRQREVEDPEFGRNKKGYRDRVRREGYHLVLKEVKRYRDAAGEVVMKANADLELAVDAIMQAENLDYVLLGTGDGDFLRLVRALQNRGRRVDLLSFSNTSTALREEVDFHHSGYLVPGVLPSGPDAPDNLRRGVMHAVNEEKGFGFLTVRTGYGPEDLRDDVFLHITDFNPQGPTLSNEEFARLKERRAVVEFELEVGPDGKAKAVNAAEHIPN